MISDHSPPMGICTLTPRSRLPEPTGQSTESSRPSAQFSHTVPGRGGIAFAFLAEGPPISEPT